MDATEEPLPSLDKENHQLGCESRKICKRIRIFKQRLKNVVTEFTGHDSENFSTFENFTKWMHKPTDAAALGIFRILYGFCMLVDIPEERGGGNLDLRFGEPKHCHFPLFNFIKPFPLPFMGIAYFVMWLGALGIMLGYKFRRSCLMFLIPYAYVFLLDKPAWNNHSYLYGLCALLLLFTDANRYCSLDYRKLPQAEQVVPYWNYFLIKFQFFLLYFYAGLKKMTFEWLSGYAMTNLGYHWVFTPFRLFLSVELVELLIIHWFTAVFDLTIAFWLTYEKTRLAATPFVISFHLMNSRLFTIGMFPWLCLCELHLFYNLSWPREIRTRLKSLLATQEQRKETDSKSSADTNTNSSETSPKKEKVFGDQISDSSNASRMKEETSMDERLYSKKTSPMKKKACKDQSSQRSFMDSFRVILILSYCAIQLFLPYSHFITKGYNNWTNGAYGYSWDMMVHAYDTLSASVKIVDNNNGRVHYLEPYAFTEYDRWTKHADMAKQYAKCIERNLIKDFEENPKTLLTSKNFSIYFDIWCSMNGRFQQRVFDPRVDLLKAKWSPFEQTEWVLPVIKELNNMRPILGTITRDVLSWSNHSDCLFIADYPGLTLENFISPDLTNVTMTVLQGAVHYEVIGDDQESSCPLSIGPGQRLNISPGELHRVVTVSKTPSCYMYTFLNQTMADMGITLHTSMNKRILPLWEEFLHRAHNYKYFFYHVGNSFLFLVYGVPMPLRIRERM